MLFNSLEFAVYFPLVTFLFFLLPHGMRIGMLLLASCVFYMAFIPKYILVLFVTIAVDYWAGLAMDQAEGRKKKLILAASLIANVGLLFVFKYYNFFNENLRQLALSVGAPWVLPTLTWALPIGLSFHTFQAMAYTIEVYGGRQKAERNLAVYALYVLFYPQLVAGPIERPQNLLTQLHKHHAFNADDLASGLRQMLWGFFKKLVIADRLTVLVDAVYADPDRFPGPIILAAIVLFSFQIYCDFSGYTDIAIGAARVMGIRLRKNFDQPYLSGSVTEFWKRWHISLSTWFRDYLYIPLGGSRVSRLRVYANFITVFLVSGFWHGANWTFLAWGLLHGLFVILERAMNRSERKGPLAIALTFSLVAFAWVFFRSSSLSAALAVLSGLTRGWVWEPIRAGLLDLSSQGFTFADLVLSFGLCAFLVGLEALDRRKPLVKLLDNAPIAARWFAYYAGILCVLLLGKYTREQFIYFQF